VTRKLSVFVQIFDAPLYQEALTFEAIQAPESYVLETKKSLFWEMGGIRTLRTCSEIHIDLLY
jgi:hypothetical protein